jgi:hypothetical protein
MPDILRFLRRRKWAVRVEMLRLGQLIRYRRFSNKHLPTVFGNAMPKSGSHILSQFLEGLSNFTPLVFTDIHPVRTYTVEGRYRSPEEILADLKRLKNGDIGWGYLRATEANIEAITQPDMVTYFAYRDPRDVIVSHILYAMTIHEGHRMRPFYQSLPSMEERVRATIAGVEDERYSYPDIRTDYERYLPFLEQPGVMSVRFEDLIYSREETLNSMMDKVEGKGLTITIDREEARAILNKSMSPSRSPTFRSGISGSWREHFSEVNKDLFKEIAGDLLIRLGYEASNDW